VAPSTDAAVAIGPAVMLVWIIFGGFYCNADNIPRCGVFAVLVCGCHALPLSIPLGTTVVD
jgi:hypothetical protein